MRFFGSAIFAVATLASIVSGQASGTATGPPVPSATPDLPESGAGEVVTGGDNPISAPTAGDELEAGKPITIVWKPTTDGTITLRLRKGDSSNLDTVLDITKDVPNTGSFTWTPPTKLEGDEDYAVEIIPANGAPNYSPKFAIDSDGEGFNTSTATTMTTSTTKTTTSPATTTTDADDEEETTTTSSKTTTSKSSTKTDEPEEEEEDEDTEDVPNTNAASGIASSPMALVLCLAAAVAYLN